jgi:pimeloyl-ACP methyl ester carboxylesterase
LGSYFSGNRRYLLAALLIMGSIGLSLWTDGLAVSRKYVELTLDDGVKSSVAIYEPRGDPEAGALLLHGFSGTKENLALVSSSLARAGYVVFAPDWRGHGGTGGTLQDGATGVTSDIRVYSEALRSMYNLSFTLVGGHSMGGGFAQIAALELHPRFLVLICSPANPEMVDAALAEATHVLLVAASLDTVVGPNSVVASATRALNQSVTVGTTYSTPDGGSLLVSVIENYDHLLVLYGEPLSTEVLKFVGSAAKPPFSEVILSKAAAAVVFVVGLLMVIPSVGDSAEPALRREATQAVSLRRVIALYSCSGLLLPVASWVISLVPGVGTGSFFIGLFLSVAIVMAAAGALRLVSLRLEPLRIDPMGIALGASWGLIFVAGLHVIVGSDLIRLLPSPYGLVALVVTAPVAAGFSLVEVALLDEVVTMVPRWLVGMCTKVVSLAVSVLTVRAMVGSMAGLLVIFAYTALALLLPLYVAESELSQRGQFGRAATIAMFVVVLSLLVAASSART